MILYWEVIFCSSILCVNIRLIQNLLLLLKMMQHNWINRVMFSTISELLRIIFSELMSELFLNSPSYKQKPTVSPLSLRQINTQLKKIKGTLNHYSTTPSLADFAGLALYWFCSPVRLQGDLLCLPAWKRYQKTGCCIRRAGQGCRRALRQQQNQYSICSFVCGGPGEALLEPYKMTHSRVLVSMFLTKRSEIDSARVAWRPNVL